MSETLSIASLLTPESARGSLQTLEDEMKLRRERKVQACIGGLVPFVRYFWSILEPETKLVEGWLLDAIAEHLEAVTLGKITRLLINVPPGSMKSLMTQVFWPAWEWGPMSMPYPPDSPTALTTSLSRFSVAYLRCFTSVMRYVSTLFRIGSSLR